MWIDPAEMCDSSKLTTEDKVKDVRSDRTQTTQVQPHHFTAHV